MTLLKVFQIRVQRDVVNPRLEGWVEKLQPLLADLEHQGTTHEQMLEAETSRHTAEVEQVSGEQQEKSTMS